MFGSNPRGDAATQAVWLAAGLLLAWLLGSCGAALALAALSGDLWLGPRRTGWADERASGTVRSAP